MKPGSGTQTRQRILQGAVLAVEQRGLSRLGMSEVSRCAGVSRATLFRYFPTRELLLDAVAVEEGERFFETVLTALRAAEGEERIEVMLQLATRHVREHRALQHLLETEQAFLLDNVATGLMSVFRMLNSGQASPVIPAAPSITRRTTHAFADDTQDWTI